MTETDRPANAQPSPAVAYVLSDLLALMSPETFPDDEDFGPAVGGELW